MACPELRAQVKHLKANGPELPFRGVGFKEGIRGLADLTGHRRNDKIDP